MLRQNERLFNALEQELSTRKFYRCVGYDESIQSVWMSNFGYKKSTRKKSGKNQQEGIDFVGWHDETKIKSLVLDNTIMDL